MTPTTRTPKTTTRTAENESPSAAASRYQQLRSHLSELKLTAAAEALPAVLDQAVWLAGCGSPAYPPQPLWPISMSMPPPV
jgi:hypothetical protein